MDETGCGKLQVTTCGSHDTASAVVAVPTTTSDYAYLSSGTWSLIGLEVDTPVINDASYAANVTNEGGVYGTFRLLKNVMGLWIGQQCRATWRAAGQEYSYDDLTRLAGEAGAFRCPSRKIAHEKWLICPIWDASSKIASENTGYLNPEALKPTFSKK